MRHNGRAMHRWFRLNDELLLAVVTLIALLVGWIGGLRVSGLLPQWAIWTAAVVSYLAGGYSGVVQLWQDARRKTLNIESLMLAGALGAGAIGAWEEGALLLFLFTLSGGLETLALDRTRRAIEALSKLYPDEAIIRKDGAQFPVRLEELQVGDVALVFPGTRLPTDGVVLKGVSTVDQSPITGESVPVYKESGDVVFAGTINGSGALEVEVKKLASESTLSKIIQLIEAAQKDPAPAQRFFDRFSQPYTLTVFAATALTFFIPLLFIDEPFGTTFYRAITLMVVASPCALIISTPASILSAIGAAARAGVLLKGGAYLDKTAAIEAIAFDKTGTLTVGKPQVVDVRPLQKYSEANVLQIAASAERKSEHPIGQAIVRRAQSLGLDLEEPEEFHSVAGHGVQACFQRDGHVEVVYIGNDKLFMDKQIELSPAIRMIGQALQQQGKTAMLVVRSSQERKAFSGKSVHWEPVGYIAVADTLRAEAKRTIEALKNLGIRRIAMLTGDNRNVANHIAKQGGVEEVFSELLPEQKVEIVHQLAQEGKLLMVGDGVNDAPALAAASVGMAMGGAGSDVALETADVVLMNDDLSKLPFFIRLSRQAVRVVRQNVVFSISVIVGLIFSTLVLPALIPGFVLPLPLGVVGHEGSTLIVVLNGLRLLAMRPGTH